MYSVGKMWDFLMFKLVVRKVTTGVNYVQDTSLL
jgi:hypothetical protein